MRHGAERVCDVKEWIGRLLVYHGEAATVRESARRQQGGSGGMIGSTEFARGCHRWLSLDAWQEVELHVTVAATRANIANEVTEPTVADECWTGRG